MTFSDIVYLVLDRRITVGNGVFGTENDVSVITLCFHSKNVGFTDAFVVDPHWISDSI